MLTTSSKQRTNQTCGWRQLDHLNPPEDLLFKGSYSVRAHDLVVTGPNPDIRVMQHVELYSDRNWERFFGHVTVVKGRERAV